MAEVVHDIFHEGRCPHHPLAFDDYLVRNKKHKGRKMVARSARKTEMWEQVSLRLLDEHTYLAFSRSWRGAMRGCTVYPSGHVFGCVSDHRCRSQNTPCYLEMDDHV